MSGSDDDAVERYDMCVFGATGFTGKRVLRYAIAEAIAEVGRGGRQRELVMAGRNESAMINLRGELCQAHDAKHRVSSWLRLHVCNVDDDESLFNMARSSKVVINCVGPYRFFGEAVVRACVKAGADYVDVCGEPEFMQRMLLKYDKEARAKKVAIVSACGFDSIYADVGVLSAADDMQKRHKAVCNSVEGFLSIQTGRLGLQGHYATYASAVHGFGSAPNLAKVRREIAKRPDLFADVPRAGRQPRLNRRPHWDHRMQRYVFPFPGADASVVRQSQIRLTLDGGGGGGQQQQAHKQTHPHFGAYFTVSSLWMCLVVSVVGTVFNTLASYAWGRWLLLRFPRLFSFGAFSHAGPSDEQIRQTSFTYTFFAEGAPSSASSSSSAAATTKRTRVDIQGPEPGYVATPIAVHACAQLLIDERPKCAAGGVLTPGAAFRHTTLIDRLRTSGIGIECSDVAALPVAQRAQPQQQKKA